MAIKGLLFDKDATIIDFRATFEPATNQVLMDLSDGDPERLAKLANAVSFNLETETIGDDSVIIAGSGNDIAAALAPIIGKEDVEEFARELDQRFGEVCVRTVVELPGAIASLEQLSSEGYTLGIATNDAAENARSQMRKLETLRLFDHVLGADSGFGGKPGPGMVKAFLEKVGVEPSETLMIGDSTHDLEAGRAAGVTTCAVLTGPATRQELAPLADHVLSSIVELPGLLQQL